MKDPAILFYPNDWIGGTMGMTFEEKGAYMELLMLQFNRGHMTTHMIGQSVGQLWVKVQDKFIKDENGLWYNKRLEEEKIKRQKYVNSRRNNIIGTNQYSKNKDKKGQKNGGHMTVHMENENINEYDYSILRNTEYINTVYSNKIKAKNLKISLDKFYQLVDDFISTQTLARKKYINKEEYQSHFINWLAIQVKKRENKDLLRTI